MEENPFESLARGLDRDLSALPVGAKPNQSNRALLISVAPAFGMSTVPVRSGSWHPRPFGEQPLESLSDRFVEQIAVFPVAKHVVINKFGAYVPQSLFGLETEIAYREVPSSDGSINITIHPKQPPTLPVKRPQFGSARGLIKISDDFDEPLQDFIDYM